MVCYVTDAKESYTKQNQIIFREAFNYNAEDKKKIVYHLVEKGRLPLGKGQTHQTRITQFKHSH
jgi:hypothetical protein